MAAALLVAACSSERATDVDVAGTLEGRAWMLDTYVHNGAAEEVPAGIRESTIQFEGGVAMLDTSCNTGSVDYTIAGDEVSFDSLVITEIACEPAASVVEQSVVETLQGETTVSFPTVATMAIQRGEQRLVYVVD